MKICLYEPDPRVCGPLSWAGHLKRGFEENGHEVQTLSSTKSGRSRLSWGQAKWGGHWWNVEPDLICKDADLGDVLAKFDMCVLPEPKSPAEDKAAVKEHRWPVYYLGLWKSGVRFVTAFHGNDYTSKSAPYMEHLFQLPGFCGKVMSHSERSRLSSDIASGIPYFSSPLPYAPSLPIDAGYPTVQTIGTTGRFMFNKGPHVVALAAQYLIPETTVELWGSASTGLGTNVTFSVYEGLLDQAASFLRYGDQEEKKAAGDPRANAHGNTIRPYHWDMRLKTGQLVRYLGNYTDPVGIAGRLSVHVNLTGLKYSGGLVEFSTLEAMDAGSMCITPAHVSDDRYRTKRIDIANPPGAMKSALGAVDLVKSLATSIAEVQEFATQGDHATRRSIVEHNRECIRTINDPAAIARQIVDEAM